MTRQQVHRAGLRPACRSRNPTQGDSFQRTRPDSKGTRRSKGIRIPRVWIACCVLIFATPVRGQMDAVTKQLGRGSQSTLSDSKIASGLKEALQVGAGNAVKLTGHPD